MKEQCPLVLVDCPFSFAGCETQLPRKDMSEHTKESIAHLTLLATTTQKLLKENQELQQKAIEREDESCKNIAAIQASLKELNTNYNSVVIENQKLQRELNDEKSHSRRTWIVLMHLYGKYVVNAILYVVK